MSALSGQAVLEGPINNGAWIIAGRRTYFDQIFKGTAFYFPYFFYDLQGHVYQDITKNQRLSLSWYRGEDNLKWDDEFGIDFGYITTLHPWLSYQNLTDGSLQSISSPGHFWNDFSLGRASTESLIPKSTTLVNALQKVIPKISSNLEAISFRVPTGIVSASDLTITLKKNVSSNYMTNMKNLYFPNPNY